MLDFKALCIDGGGIKGLYSARILQHLEAELQRRDGPDARIVDYADLISGTSTGGLIALALSLRIPAEAICTFYEQRGPDIFRGSEGIWGLLKQTLLRGKFSDRRLREALREMYGDSRLGDSHCLLCIPTYDLTHGTYGVFKYDHAEGSLSRHNRLAMVDVGLATSAAPTFFPLAQIDMENNTQYVDGGVWANNPSLVGFAEALAYFVGPGKAFDRLNLISIATINGSSGSAPLLRRRRSFVQWAPDLFNLSLVAQSEFADVVLTLMEARQLLPMVYTRIPSAQVSSRHEGYLKLDLATPQAFTLMRQYADEVYYQYRSKESVQQFFAEPKHYRTKGK